jgi:2-oxoisovalerate dehydrogenase E1 component alpha subunit
MYKNMLKLNNLDKVFYDAQRQGRISFYMTSFGEEATHIGAAAAIDQGDTIFAQYREAGVLLWRGFTLPQMAHQCFGTHEDLGKGRQMPVHYGSRELNFQTISSPLATQLPQAVGHAYSMKRAGKKDNITVCFFGEGAASEGDFHAALNFSATLEAPVMFFCRNNGYAISTPVQDQYRGDGIAGRAGGYGIKTIRVDGNDLLAVYDATEAARNYIIENQKPCVVETMSYRAGHHSTSDDSTRYRAVEEIEKWQSTNNPLIRVRNLLQSRGLWNQDMEDAENNEARKLVLEALTEAEVAKKPAVSQLFQDVYDVLPKHLIEQQQEWNDHMAKYGEHYGLEEFVPNDQYKDPALM